MLAKAPADAQQRMLPGPEAGCGARRELGYRGCWAGLQKVQEKKKKKRGEGKKYPKQNKPHGEAGAKAHQERMISKGTTAEAR